MLTNIQLIYPFFIYDVNTSIGPRSLLVMRKSPRYDYKHSISKDLIEYFFNNNRYNNGDNNNQLNCREEIIRSRRVSLTFRTIIEVNNCIEQQ